MENKQLIGKFKKIDDRLQTSLSKISKIKVKMEKNGKQFGIMDIETKELSEYILPTKQL